MKYLIIAADRIMDGVGDHSRTQDIILQSKNLGLKTSVLEIVSLAKRWEDKLLPHQFKSGASAMDAVNRARELLDAQESDIVIIRGEDFLRSGYTKDERENFMKLYEGKFTPLDGYNELVTPFMKHNGINKEDFFVIRDALFENYAKTWKRENPDKSLPSARWFDPLTEYFRGVDCANPNIDYSGQIIITTEKQADILKVPLNERVSILGNAFRKLPIDGFESIPHIASYDHLKDVIDEAVGEAQINFKAEFLQGNALLEAYTCYPVVPMALLLKLKLVEHLCEIPSFLNQYEVTITGGLNLARAPWNLTSLNYMIAMREKLLTSRVHKYGLIHGNGSLGNQQGIALLGR